MIHLLCQVYLNPIPPGQRGFKRVWRLSRGLRPGCWYYNTYTLDDAIRSGPFEFDEEGVTWDYKYEEWIPVNYELRERVWDMEIVLENEIGRRDEDYLSYVYCLLRNFIF